MRNKFCDSNDLRNEADVEQSFVRRLLEELGYSDREILPKQSLDALTIGGMRGNPQESYRPDFGLRVSRHIRWIVEAKSPDEDLDRHEWQPRAYSVLLNGTRRGKTVRYHVLTNGDETRLFDPDLNEPLQELSFADFADGNRKFQEFRSRVARDRITVDLPGPRPESFRLEKRSLSDVNSAFAWCHQHIYRKDDISQSDAFTEFVKLIALKLMADRRIRERHPEILMDDAIEVLVDEVDFSIHWIEENERNTHSPINDILFRNFMRDMETQIANEARKRIFEPTDEIRLKPETIKGVVKRLEKIFLFGIDADLNGRLFETFLNATMRGKDLGQFFTPRSLIKLGVRLCQLQVHVRRPDGQAHTDTVIDACCGTGGFLIDALADMWAKVERRGDLSSTERISLKRQIANNQIVGIDVANAPILARIARLNMYLHGDGGTRLFHINALDKELRSYPTDSPDIA
jgi:type I restriction enzyme M protein